MVLAAKGFEPREPGVNHGVTARMSRRRPGVAWGDCDLGWTRNSCQNRDYVGLTDRLRRRRKGRWLSGMSIYSPGPGFRLRSPFRSCRFPAPSRAVFGAGARATGTLSLCQHVSKFAVRPTSGASASGSGSCGLWSGFASRWILFIMELAKGGRSIAHKCKSFRRRRLAHATAREPQCSALGPSLCCG